MSSAKVLIVLEGEQPEKNTLARLQRAFPEELADLSEDLVKIIFKSNIYSLYGKLNLLTKDCQEWQSFFMGLI